MNINPNPNMNNPDKHTSLNQQNLKELYNMFKYMKSNVITNNMLEQQKEQHKQQIEDYLDQKVVQDYNTLYNEFKLI
jgi:hypothetical protein